MQLSKMRMFFGLTLGSCLTLFGCGSNERKMALDDSEVTQVKNLDSIGSAAQFRGFTRNDAEDLSTKYPIVLHHGLCGYDKILFIDYYFGIPDRLRAKGADVHVVKVDPVATIRVRAEQLGRQIDAILTKTGAGKVNLVGHSMGGLDARYLVSTLGYGDRVASVSTLASPHQGTLVSDVIYQAIKRGSVSRVLDLLESLTGQKPECSDLNDRSCEQKIMRSAWNIRGVAWNLSEEFMQKYFNPRNPPDSRVYYQSYSGIASRWGWPGRPPKVEEIFAPVYLFLKAVTGDNDGLVPTKSAIYGEDRGVLPADHLDIIGHLMGETGGRFEHVDFFERMVREFQLRGF